VTVVIQDFEVVGEERRDRAAAPQRDSAQPRPQPRPSDARQLRRELRMLAERALRLRAH
jgi:hypothetical protein